MTYPAGGSQPKVDPKQFLASYLDTESMKEGREAAPGDEALHGKVGNTVKDKYSAGVIKV
jgi:hypothetical protein